MFEFLFYYSRRIIDIWYGSDKTSDKVFEASILIKKILFIHAQLASLRQSGSFGEIKDLFSELRLLCTRSVDDRVSNLILENPRVSEIKSDLRNFCSEIECDLEKEWGLKAAGDEKVCARIRGNFYFDTYSKLVNAELSVIQSLLSKPIKKIAFIGSGAMPLTSLCLMGRLTDTPTNISILNIDRDAEALEISKILCERLGSKAQEMEFYLAEAGSSLELEDFDVVYVAALVGNTQEQKEDVLEQVTSRMRPGALLVTRGGRKLRSLIYTVFDPTTERVSKLLNVAAVIDPQKYNIVNSVFVGRVKQKSPSSSSTEVEGAKE
ncbi:Nicotianamine synthase 9 [Erysiphe neolycopersici]|uniref:Nicotianamine synthase 9 n=1 Tax=Erysiphe neolycopersici TaxID=212602 RepID=A0A420HTY2_9PEZI|nr:Nicotianamine synthase 9 [Erysiphe neolycopersici]